MEPDSRSEGVTLDDVRAWASRADELDEIEAATTLLAAGSFLTDDADDASVVVARTLNFLLLGRAAEARATIDAAAWERGDRADMDAARDAVAAAVGDDDAWVRLVNGVARFPGVLTIFLLAAAAECRGDMTNADTAWLALRDDIGRRSGLVLARAAVADISRSLSSPLPNARGRAIYRSAAALSRVRGGLSRDPRWALDAVQRLDGRGDSAGARLLAEVLVSTVKHPPARVVDESRRRTPQPGMRRYRTVMAVAFVVALGFVWLGILWLLAISATRAVIDSHVRVPGLTIQDSRAWRSLRPRVVGAGYEAGATSLSGWVGLLIYLPVALVAALFAAAATSSSQSYAVIILIWSAALIAIPALAVFAAQQAWTWWRSSRSRAAADLTSLASAVDASRCQCWSTVWQSDEVARMYMRQHLVPVPLEGDLGAVAAVGAMGTWVGECPDSGIRWLGWQTTPEGGFLALRGSAAAPPEWATVDR